MPSHPNNLDDFIRFLMNIAPGAPLPGGAFVISEDDLRQFNSHDIQNLILTLLLNTKEIMKTQEELLNLVNETSIAIRNLKINGQEILKRLNDLFKEFKK